MCRDKFGGSSPEAMRERPDWMHEHALRVEMACWTALRSLPRHLQGRNGQDLHAPAPCALHWRMTDAPDLTLLLDSFERNARVNRVVIDAISEDEWAVSDGRGGRSIGQLLGELAEFRYGWLMAISPAHAESIPSVVEGDEPDFRLTATTIEELHAAFEAGDAAAKKAVLEAIAEGRTFSRAYESHPAHFLQHILVHDAHHRGQIMTLLRQSGRSASSMDDLERTTWPIWRE